MIKYNWRSPFRVDKKWFEELEAQRSLTDMKNFTGKLLAISGMNDSVLSWQNANRVVEVSASQDATAIVMKGADHIFNVFDANAHHSEALLRVTVDWLKIKL